MHVLNNLGGSDAGLRVCAHRSRGTDSRCARTGDSLGNAPATANQHPIATPRTAWMAPIGRENKRLRQPGSNGSLGQTLVSNAMQGQSINIIIRATRRNLTRCANGKWLFYQHCGLSMALVLSPRWSKCFSCGAAYALFCACDSACKTTTSRLEFQYKASATKHPMNK